MTKMQYQVETLVIYLVFFVSLSARVSLQDSKNPYPYVVLFVGEVRC